MPPVKGKSSGKYNMFKKDENVLPFFSIHPKTKVGTVLRIVLVAFMVFVIILNLVANFAHITLTKATTFYPLTYFVPIILAFALIVVALFKRMRTPITKVVVAVVSVMVLMIAVSIISTYINLMPLMLLSQNEVSLPTEYAKLAVETEDGKQNIVLMQQYARPDGSVEKLTSDGVYDLVCPYKVDAVRITVAASDGDDVEVSGTIYLAQNEIDKLNIEWTDENHVRIYLSDGFTSLITEKYIGKAGIVGENRPYSYTLNQADLYETTSKASGDSELYFRTSTNEQGTHTILLYRTNVDAYKASSIYEMSQESLKKEYTAYPSLLFGWLVRTDRETEGILTLQPYGSMESLQVSYLGEDTISIKPGTDAIGASGEIILHASKQETRSEPSDDRNEAASSKAPLNSSYTYTFSEINVEFGK